MCIRDSAQSGYGYSVGISHKGEFNLPDEDEKVEWLDYNSSFTGTFDYVHNNLMISFGGKSYEGNISYNGAEESNADTYLKSRFISFGIQDILKIFNTNKQHKVFDNLKLSSYGIFSYDEYGFLDSNTNTSVGIGFSCRIVSLGSIWPYMAYDYFSGSIKSKFHLGFSLFLQSND